MPRLEGLGRAAALHPHRESARLLPLHRRRVSLPARGGGPDAHVRRRGRHPSAPTAASTTSRTATGARLSTAFDSTTLYGEDPDTRPDIYGRTGNSGVSIATLDDMKKLYSGFDLCEPTTSVSMTINGPAPIILAMFMNTAIDQQVERHLQAAGGWEAAQRQDRRAACAERRARRRAARLQGRAAGGITTARGSALLGVTGEQLLEPRRSTSASRRAGAAGGARHGAGRHPQGGSGAEHLHLLHRVRAAHDGRRAAVLHRAAGAQLLLGVDLRLPHRRGRREPDLAARLHARQRLHDRRVLPGARHEDR